MLVSRIGLSKTGSFSISTSIWKVERSLTSGNELFRKRICAIPAIPACLRRRT